MIPHTQLAYTISEKNDFIVVTFEGAMNKLTVATLDQCHREIAERPAKRIVLNFQATVQVERGAVPPLVRIQKAIREKPGGQLRLCYLRNDLRAFLLDSGAVRPHEIAKSLEHALISLSEPQ